VTSSFEWKIIGWWYYGNIHIGPRRLQNDERWHTIDTKNRTWAFSWNRSTQAVTIKEYIIQSFMYNRNSKLHAHMTQLWSRIIAVCKRNIIHFFFQMCSLRYPHVFRQWLLQVHKRKIMWHLLYLVYNILI